MTLNNSLKDEIVVENLSFCYQNACVFQKASFKILENEFVGIIGPNGAGKTTLIKLLLGLMPPDSGTISFTAEKKVGYVTQDAGFDRDFPITVFEVVLMGTYKGNEGLLLKPTLEHLRKAENALKEIQIGHLRERSIKELSLGELKKVLIARAIAGDAEVLIFDEHSVSQDVDSVEIFYESLKLLKGKKTILLISHDIKPVFSLCDKFLYINKGIEIYENNEEHKKIIIDKLYLQRG